MEGLYRSFQRNWPTDLAELVTVAVGLYLQIALVILVISCFIIHHLEGS